MNKLTVTVVGAGLAGSEAAYQLAIRGYQVKLYEMRPVKMTEAHKTAGFAELICSNSLRAASTENAVGLLKEEMRMLDSLIMKAADCTKVEAGGALAVDRDAFSEYVTKTLEAMPNVEIIKEEVTSIPEGPVIIASGPLTSGALHEAINAKLGTDYLYFFDAIAPIVTYESIDKEKTFVASRYNKGEASYINCPMNKEEFDLFYDYLINAECVQPKDFELKVFEGCMPIEEMARRGRQTLLFGPLKPVGLDDPRTGRWPYAVVQLRKDNSSGTLYNLVGFQTHLKYGAQKELLARIPGLENCEIVRYGVMHRNTYMLSPKLLNSGYQLKSDERIFFAGQMTGVEGYVESASSGMVAGINMARYLEKRPLMQLSNFTATGALALYVTNPTITDFVPMNVNFGIFGGFDSRVPKRERKEQLAKRAIEKMAELIESNQLKTKIEHHN